MVQNPPMPNPVDVKRGEYLQRGTLPLILLAAPLAALAANAPLVAIIAATALLWLLLTLAYNTEPQLEREGKRGGEQQKLRFVDSRGDFSLASGQSPAAGHSPHTAASHHLYGGNRRGHRGSALPVHTISWYFTADWGIPVPLLNDVPFSASGAGRWAVSWPSAGLGHCVRPTVDDDSAGGRRTGAGSNTVARGAPPTEVGGAPPAPVAPAPKGGGAAPCCSPYGHHHRGLVRDADSGHADQLDAVRLERGGISHISHPHTWPLCIRYVRSVTLLQGIHLRSALGAVLLRPGHYDGAQTLKRLQGDSYVRSEASGQACHTR